jgi:E3 ubiquitin-protein ligase RNF115/126
MQAAGPQGPLPATEAVIEGLPRTTFKTDKELEESVYKDCPVCKDDFAVGDEVMRVPCA